MLYLGIDIGGTGVKAGLVDEQGQIRHHVQTPTRASEGPSVVLDRIEQAARSVIGRANEPVAGCGVGCAGRIDHRKGVVVFASGNLPGWTGLSLGPDLSRRLALPVTVDNDVNAAAAAEGWIGAARGTADFIMLTLGTGVGGAVVIGGKLWRGARWGAGEVGHTVLYPQGLSCNCGGRGCVEQYVSAKALTRRASTALPSGRPFRGIREVLIQADRGPEGRREAARTAVEGFTGDLALLLVNLQQSFDPQVIIIGGGITKLGYWWDRLVEATAREARPRSLTIRVKAAHFGPQSGVVGAARLAAQAHRRDEPASRRTERLQPVDA